MSEEIRSEEEGQAAIDHEMETIFHSVLDISKSDLSEAEQAMPALPNRETALQTARRKEFFQVIRDAKEIILKRLEEGRGKVGTTIESTFADDKITEPTADRLVDAIPSQEGGKLLLLTDLHGDITALRAAVRRFLEDDKVQLAVLGDVLAGGGEQQVEALEAIFKLYTKYPDRVHLLRGNCEVAVFPEEGSGEQVYEATGMTGWRQGMSRLQDLFSYLPAIIVTENGVAATHASLPRPKTEGEERQFCNLDDINNFGGYQANVLMPVYTELGQSAGEKVDSLNLGQGAGLRDMLWGDIDTSAEQGYAGARAYVSNAEDLDNEMNAIGASVLFRGHQSKLLKDRGSNLVIDDHVPVATFHSSFKGNKQTTYMAEIPLDRPVDKITEDMFIGVEKEQK